MKHVPAARWRDEVVYIIGGGPSARDLDLGLLKDRGIVVGVNDAAFAAPHVDAVFSADRSWMQRRVGHIDAFEGAVIVALPLGVAAPFMRTAGVLRLTRLDGPGLSDRPGCIHYAENSGYGALAAVVAQGARRIVLIGFDMTGPGHWHDGYSWPCRFGVDQYPSWAAAFAGIGSQLRARGVQVWNANPESAIAAFPREPYTELLDDLALDYWWSGQGLAHITPPEAPLPEGDGFLAWLQQRVGAGTVFEFGCGTGRLAGGFAADRYIGGDISRDAIGIARRAHPRHQFGYLSPEMPLPDAHVTLAHTVLLHVPDRDLGETVSRFRSHRVIVSEILGRQWRRPGNPPVYNRDAADYCDVLERAGYQLDLLTERPYERYGDHVRLSVLEFSRVASGTR